MGLRNCSLLCPTAEGRSWVFCVILWIRSFSILAGWNRYCFLTLCKLWASDWFFPWPTVVSVHAHADQYSAEFLKGVCEVLCAALPFLVLCLRTQATLVRLVSELSLFNSGNLLGFTSLFPSTVWFGNSLKKVRWDNCRTQFFVSWLEGVTVILAWYPVSWEPLFHVFCVASFLFLFHLFQKGG